MLNRQCRKTLRRLSAHAVAVLLLGAFASSQEVAAEVGSIAPLRLHWELISADASITVAPGGSLAAMKLTNSGDGPLSGQHWAIYFTCLEGVETGPLTGGLAIDRVVGALFRLRPTADFIALEPGQTLRVTLVHPGAIINLSQAPENPYLVPDEARDAGLPILDYTIGAFPAAPGARTAEYAYTRNAGIVTVPVDSLPPVFPTPREFERRPGSVHWAALPRISGPAALREAIAAATALLKPYFPSGLIAAAAPEFRMRLAPISGLQGPEAYALIVDPDKGVELQAATAAGATRALASFRQLLPVRANPERGVDLPALQIRDAPRFAYRGLMLDVARNFQPRSEVLRVLDLMARYKLNTLHFHLTDDEGWRLEIAGLPELTTIGGRRGHPDPKDERLPPAYGSGPDAGNAWGSGYYRRSEYLEILRYAAARHIEVIPEIEMPGHARAAIVAMAGRARRLAQAGRPDAGKYLLRDPADRSAYQSPQLYGDNAIDPGLESVYVFITRIVDELIAMHRAAGVPLRTIHVGGDELPAGAWERSPATQALMQRRHLNSRADVWDYFYTRVDALLHERGVATAGWEELGAREAMIDGRPQLAPNPTFSKRGYTLYVWRNIDGAEDMAYRLANAGYDTVLTPASRLYFDLAPYPSRDEPGQNWAGYVGLNTVFDYVPYDDARLAPDDPTPLANRERLTESGRRHIRGLEGTLFSETVHEPGRLDYMLMPRLLALAERAWAPDPSWAQQTNLQQAASQHATAWSTFLSQLGLQVLPQIDAELPALSYRIPPPGLRRVDGKVLANEEIPGFLLRYTVDGSEPNPASPLFTGPIASSGEVRVAAFNAAGRAGRSAMVAAEGNSQ